MKKHKIAEKELLSCYRACKDLFGQLNIITDGKVFKEMISNIDTPEPVLNSLPESKRISWTPSFRYLIDTLKFTDSSHETKTDFYSISEEMDHTYPKTSHGFLSDGPNLFARALNAYVKDTLESSGKKYNLIEFEKENQLWYANYSDTYPGTDELAGFSSAFDEMITDLKEKNVLKEMFISKKMTMNDVRSIVNERRSRMEASSGFPARMANDLIQRYK